MVRTTLGKQISRTVFEDYDLFNKSAFFNYFLNNVLAKTRRGVIYDFYFFSQSIFLLFSAKTLSKMTGYDLQLHLRYRSRDKTLLIHKNAFRQDSEFQGFFKTQ